MESRPASNQELTEEIRRMGRLHAAELAAKDRELDWLRIENLHFLEKIGQLIRERNTPPYVTPPYNDV